MDETTSPRPDLESIRNPDTDFERSDLSLRVIGFAALGLALLLGLSPVALIYGFSKIGSDVDRKLHVVPPRPTLQIHPASDLRAQLAQQRNRIDSYGWMDSAHQTARIPITEAMKRAAATGLDGFPAPQPRESQP